MSTLSLDVETTPSESHVWQGPSGTPLFPTVARSYLPGRGLACSFIIHEIAVFFLVFLCYSSSGIRPAASTKLSEAIDLSRANNIVYLPSLGGGSEGSGSTGAGKGDSPQLPGRSSKGFSHHGSQPIISDPPRALNSNQTVLHPTVKNPPLLKEFVPLPNIVQMANAGPPQPPQPVQPLRVKQEALAVPTRAVATLQPPKLVVPTGTAHKIPDLSALQPTPATAQLKVPDPPPVEVSDLRMRGPDQRNVLALSPIPPPPQIPVRIPAGEARGTFAISPEPTVGGPDPGPGSRAGGPADASVGIGDRPGAMASNAVGSNGEASGGGASTGFGVGVTGHGIGKGESRGGGAGSGSGAGAGVGSGAVTGSGSGAGSGPGHGGFPGITIQGGHLGTGAAGIRAAIPPGPAAYAMTVVATAGSGGGLPDFGVFSNEKVYTVFLKLNLADQRPAPSWTLQYAPLKPLARSVSVDGLILMQAILDPPYAVTKEMPEWPADASKYARKLVVVSAIMNTDGLLGNIIVRQTPDAELIPIVTEALKKWVFLPAEHIGQPVALKVLFGIPVPAAQ